MSEPDAGPCQTSTTRLSTANGFANSILLTFPNHILPFARGSSHIKQKEHHVKEITNIIILFRYCNYD
jgi:hypothetical protein